MLALKGNIVDCPISTRRYHRGVLSKKADDQDNQRSALKFWTPAMPPLALFLKTSLFIGALRSILNILLRCTLYNSEIDMSLT